MPKQIVFFFPPPLAQISSLEIFHHGSLLFFPNVVMNFKADLYYTERERGGGAEVCVIRIPSKALIEISCSRSTERESLAVNKEKKRGLGEEGEG